MLENNTRHRITPECETKLAQSSSLLINSPVLDKNNNVVPLNKHHYEINDDKWVDDVGFSTSPKNLLNAPTDKHSEASNRIG